MCSLPGYNRPGSVIRERAEIKRDVPASPEWRAGEAMGSNSRLIIRFGGVIERPGCLSCDNSAPSGPETRATARARSNPAGMQPAAFSHDRHHAALTRTSFAGDPPRSLHSLASNPLYQSRVHVSLPPKRLYGTTSAGAPMTFRDQVHSGNT